MKYTLIFTFLFSVHLAWSQVELNADGPGDTYSLITSVLAPGYNPIETPDCNHEDFGDHIDEIFDEELDAFVFRFHIHTSPDDDRCIKFDRQRNEIKSYDKSPDNLLGIEGERVIYKWKFKLAEGFQSSPNFTHIHQLKSVGGSLASMPMYTLTTRKGTPDQLELRYAKTSSQITLTKTDLEPFIGTWLEVKETITYGTVGNYTISINRVDDGTNLLSYENDEITNWRPEAEFVRPKWGIYRSLLNAQDLRDEMVLYADFSVRETDAVSTEEPIESEETFNVLYTPDRFKLELSNALQDSKLIQIYSITGQKMMERKVGSSDDFSFDTSSFMPGIYIVSVIGKEKNHSKNILLP